MGRYSGMLLCSDFDGTLAYKQVVPQKNIDAIRYFCDNGGIFTVISGRSFEFLEKYAGDLCLNSYIGCLNGSMIYHVPTRRSTTLAILPKEADSRIRSFLSQFKNILEVVIFNERCDECVKIDDVNRDCKISELMSVPTCKIVLRGITAFTEEDMVLIRQVFGEDYFVSKSCDTYAEIQSAASNKGIVARRIAELVGARTLVCAGDYENDVPLLKAADIGYAVKDSVYALKSIAHRVTVGVQDGAIAAIIDEL